MQRPHIPPLIPPLLLPPNQPNNDINRYHNIRDNLGRAFNHADDRPNGIANAGLGPGPRRTAQNYDQHNQGQQIRQGGNNYQGQQIREGGNNYQGQQIREGGNNYNQGQQRREVVNNYQGQQIREGGNNYNQGQQIRAVVNNFQGLQIREGGSNYNQEQQIRAAVNNFQGLQIRDGGNIYNQEQQIRAAVNNFQGLQIRDGGNIYNQGQQRREGGNDNQGQQRWGGGNNNQGQQRMEGNNNNQGQQRREGGNNNRPQNNNKSSGKYFSYTYLNDLSNKDSDEVVTTLAKRKDEFEKFLNEEIRPDMFVLTLRVLTNICQANFTEIITSVLSNACSANFLKNLQQFLNKLPFESDEEKVMNQQYHKDKNQFWSDLARFFKKVTELLPNKARDELSPILEKLNRMIPTIEGNQEFKINDKVKDDLKIMSKKLKEEIKKVEKKNKAREIRPSEPEVEQDPPENFRLLSVIPTIQDLQDENPFIRPCKVKDAYFSIEHYLDVQFRLLREDFISPLRSGVREYLYEPQKNRNSDFRIYRKVNLITPKVNENSVSIILSFGQIKNINWKRTKRFMYGGLLLLSSDNLKTVLFVTVTNRDETELEKGCILIEPCQGTTITREMYNTTFVMLESKIYFEPYLAVLTAMQHMHPENFPMETYLVNAEISITMPKYLVNAYVERLQYKNWSLPVAYNEPWPSANQLKLDDSQYSAFRCALTQEFAVIQGPPGTGKTFIALEIVSTLLENKGYWKGYGPIVIVCLTNHALDQFLEGILKYTKSMVRVGSRSKSEALKQYTLMERRKVIRTPNRSNALAVMYETKREIETVFSSMKKARVCVQLLTTSDAIVPLACLTEYGINEALIDFESNEDFIKWLVGSEIILTPLPEKPIVPQQLENDPEMISEDNQNNHMDDELELDCNFKVDNNFDPIFPVKNINARIEKIHQDLNEYRCTVMKTRNQLFNPTVEWMKTINTLEELALNLQEELAQHSVLNEQRNLSRNPRWRSYWNWVRTSYERAMDDITELETLYRHLNAKLNEAKQCVDLGVLKEHEIVGLTTTGAAKLHSTLRALRAPIVLVEEAAEILEAHVVCSMTKHCQHAILIGDHKQLRPKASVYKLGTKFNLNISLFERMVNIRGDCTQLAHQHRMRPEIAKLITPSIYEKLYNHESVHGRPMIKGLLKNLFFLHHNNRETSHNEESWVNEHEAKFLLELARYLIMQGYDASEITILCTYTGQLFSLMKETARYEIFKQMRVTTIDNYQGEENKIILLSLVRNNEEGNIGFLKEENRVCVALSRARDGMYIMGNMDNLVVKNEIWPKIKKALQEENAIGDTLELRCQIHTQQITLIKDVKDFQKCPEGGCSKKCDVALLCGHTCTSVCHILDRDHLEYRCKQPCIKSCPYDHPCQIRCWEGCKSCQVKMERKLKCGHTVIMPCSTNANTFPCYIEIDVILPNCSHATKKPCYKPVKDIVCPYPCENRLPCGHVCRLKCHATKDPDHIEYKCFRDCARTYPNCDKDHQCKKRCHEKCGPCPVLVEKIRSCKHHYKRVLCSKDIEEIRCERRCDRKMTCGHKCLLKCWQPCENCQVKVKKRSLCGHDVEVKCCEEPTRLKCKRKCQTVLPCGHPCTTKCNEPCTSACKAVVNLNKLGLCGHKLQVPCYLQNTDPNSPELIKHCKEPCKAKLACEHLCKGSCGSCKQGRIHISCAEPCTNILICGHQCEVPCRLECRPCKRACELQCRHSKCNQKCGVPCTPCKEKCDWGCEHRRCTKRCSELCNIEPCNEPCKKTLKCDHPCVGLCGDPCPPLCRICNEEELTELFFGEENEPDAKFVFLEDCGHCIESNGLTKWLTESSGSIQMKTCPRCKAPIRKCMRLMNQIKKDLKDVIQVKQRVFYGNLADLESKQTSYVESLKNISSNPNIAQFHDLRKFLSNLLSRGILVKNQKRQNLCAQEIESFRIILDIVRRMFTILSLINNRTVYSYQFVKKQVSMLVEALPISWQISHQKLNDIQLELQRLNYMAELCKADAVNSILSNKKEFSTAINKLLSINRFTDKFEAEVRTEINGLQHLFTQKLVIERQMIVKAMDLKQGHWYKCPNDHIYAIGECGGAMETSKCPECGAKIGGGYHRLLNDNAVATEMDGATKPAWPQ